MEVRAEQTPTLFDPFPPSTRPQNCLLVRYWFKKFAWFWKVFVPIHKKVERNLRRIFFLYYNFFTLNDGWPRWFFYKIRNVQEAWGGVKIKELWKLLDKKTLILLPLRNGGKFELKDSNQTKIDYNFYLRINPAMNYYTRKKFRNKHFFAGFSLKPSILVLKMSPQNVTFHTLLDGART